jgi:undecaprenyl-diphosphatase
LLTFAHFVKKGSKEITWGRAFIIGFAQALAVMPGISRSGATIAAGLLMKTKKDEVARFSFLMVLIPILGAAFLDIMGGDFSGETTVGRYL